MKASTIIIGGGTFQPIRNHLSLCAPAFGKTARFMNTLIKDSISIITKMGDPNSNLVTNEDVEKFINTILLDSEIKCIVLNVAFCDFKSLPINNIASGFHSERLSTSEGNIHIEITPTEKIIGKN